MNESNGHTTEIVFITPEKASKYLAHTAPNRPKSSGKIAKFAMDIKKGEWKLTHQGIALTSDGRLLDGQNRLQAIIESGLPIWMSVTTGVKEDCFDVIDTGTNKTGANALAMMGIQPRNARIIASAVPYCVSYESGYQPQKSIDGKRHGNSNLLVVNYFKTNPKIASSADFVSKMPRRDCILKESLSCFFHYQIKKIGRSDADEFLLLLLTGENLDSDSVVFEMRRQLIASRIGNLRLIDQTIIKRIIVTYNFYHSRRISTSPVQVIRRADKYDNPRIG